MALAVGRDDDAPGGLPPRLAGATAFDAAPIEVMHDDETSVCAPAHDRQTFRVAHPAGTASTLVLEPEPVCARTAPASVADDPLAGPQRRRVR